MTTTSPSARGAPAPRHVAWVARGGAGPAPSGGPDREARALEGLVDAASGLGVEWLTIQDPSGGAALRDRAAALAARGVALLDTPDPLRGGPRPRDLVVVEAPVLRVLLAAEGSGRCELVGAVREIARRGLRPKAVKEATIARALAVPDVDLLVLTGGDRRVPDLLVWQVAYSEIVVLDDPWPDVTGARFEAAVAEYQRRDRRYGGLVASPVASR